MRAMSRRGKVIPFPRSPAPPSPAPTFTEVRRCRDQGEALVVRGLLESRGIGAVLRSNIAQSVHPFSVGDQGEVIVLVADREPVYYRYAMTFTDETGHDAHLRDYFKPGRPVILVPGYYQCPMLCDLTRSGLVDAMKELDWSAGNQFAVLFVSIPMRSPATPTSRKRRTC